MSQPQQPLVFNHHLQHQQQHCQQRQHHFDAGMDSPIALLAASASESPPAVLDQVALTTDPDVDGDDDGDAELDVGDGDDDAAEADGEAGDLDSIEYSNAATTAAGSSAGPVCAAPGSTAALSSSGGGGGINGGNGSGAMTSTAGGATRQEGSESSSSPPTSSGTGLSASTSAALCKKEKDKKRINNVDRACEFCRSHHKKCDGEQPCSNCKARNFECNYTVRAKRGPKKGFYDEIKKQIATYRQQYEQEKQSSAEWRTRYLQLVTSPSFSLQAQSSQQPQQLQQQQPMIMNFKPDSNDIDMLREHSAGALATGMFNPMLSSSVSTAAASSSSSLPSSSSSSSSTSLASSGSYSITTDSNPASSSVNPPVANTVPSLVHLLSPSPSSSALVTGPVYPTSSSASSTTLNHHYVGSAPVSNDHRIPVAAVHIEKPQIVSLLLSYLDIYFTFVHPFHPLLPHLNQITATKLVDALLDSPNGAVHSSDLWGSPSSLEANRFLLYAVLANAAQHLGDTGQASQFMYKARQLAAVLFDTIDYNVGCAFAFLATYNLYCDNTSAVSSCAAIVDNICRRLGLVHSNLFLTNVIILCCIEKTQERLSHLINQLYNSGIQDASVAAMHQIVGEFFYVRFALDTLSSTPASEYQRVCVDLMKRIDVAHKRNDEIKWPANIDSITRLMLYSCYGLLLCKGGLQQYAIEWAKKTASIVGANPNFKHFSLPLARMCVVPMAEVLLDVQALVEAGELLKMLEGMFELHFAVKSFFEPLYERYEQFRHNRKKKNT